MRLRELLEARLKKLLPGPESDIIVSSRVRLARNLKDKPFPWRASVSTLENNWKDLSAFLSGLPDFDGGSALFLGELDQTDRQLLVERHLISHNLMNSDLPRGVVFDRAETLSVMINEEDHLRIASLRPGLDVRAAAKAASALDSAVSSRFGTAYSAEYGFLTTCPTNAGTGMRASVLAHTPALVMNGEVELLLAELTRAGMNVRGFYGEGTRVIGDIFQISNSHTLGMDEYEIIEGIERAARAVVSYEKASRKKLLKPAAKVAAEDRIFRAQALLSSARKIDFQEAMHLISRVKLGSALGLEMKWKGDALDELTVLIQPAHIQEMMDKELTSEERDIVRAKLISQKLN